MKVFNTSAGKLHISEKSFSEERLVSFYSPEVFMKNFVNNFFSYNPGFKDYLDYFGKINSLSGLAVLNAHSCGGDEWFYSDNSGKHLVDDWIKSVDGKFAGLIIYVCNPDVHTPFFSKSAVFAPDNTVYTHAGITLGNIPASYSIFSKDLERFDKESGITNYTVNYYVDKLKKVL